MFLLSYMLHLSQKKNLLFRQRKRKTGQKTFTKEKIRLKKTYVFHRTNFLRYDRTLRLRLQSGIDWRRFFRTILRLLCFINEIQCIVRCNLSSSPWYQGGLVSAMCPVGKSSRFLAALVFFKAVFC